MSSLNSINENLRLQQIYSALVTYGAESVVDNSVLGAPRRRMQRWVYQLPEPIPELSPATRTRILLEELGPTYVKMGQIVSSQVNVLPDDWGVELDRLQNEVPTFPFETARAARRGRAGRAPGGPLRGVLRDAAGRCVAGPGASGPAARRHGRSWSRSSGPVSTRR